MPFGYDAPPDGLPLRQGEILVGLFEIRLVVDRGNRIQPDLDSVDFEKVERPPSIVVTNDCDLDWDHKAYSGQTQPHKLLEHVLLCPLWTPAELREAGTVDAGRLRRIRTNQDIRFHDFPQATVTGVSLPELIADFKNVFGLPADMLYAQLRGPEVTRRGVVSAPYMQHFMQRFYFWQSRIALPDG